MWCRYIHEPAPPRKLVEAAKWLLIDAINQDKGGHEARRIWQSGQQEVWSRPGGDTAAAVFNSAPEIARSMTTRIKCLSCMKQISSQKSLRLIREEVESPEADGRAISPMGRY